MICYKYVSVSCQAISSVEAMTDRECIFSKGKSQFTYSVEDVVSCHVTQNSQGCGGGEIPEAYEYWVKEGK